MRCKTHPAFEADYCPSCGTSREIGGQVWPDLDAVVTSPEEV